MSVALLFSLIEASVVKGIALESAMVYQITQTIKFQVKTYVVFSILYFISLLSVHLHVCREHSYAFSAYYHINDSEKGRDAIRQCY